MPPIYVNSEIGSAKTQEAALQSIVNALTSYKEIREHISSVFQDKIALNIQICSELNTPKYIFEYIPIISYQHKLLAQLLLSDISKGSICNTAEQSPTKTLKDLDVPSPLFEYILLNDGMAFSFATHSFWKRDFIEFNECSECVPNIWGQHDNTPILSWINEWYDRNGEVIRSIESEFNINFCDPSIQNTSFTRSEWHIIKEALRMAHAVNFNFTPPLIKGWSDLPIHYIRFRNHNSFTLRIFFVKKDNKIHIGKIYHKNDDNTLKEEYMARKSFELFRNLGIL